MLILFLTAILNNVKQLFGVCGVFFLAFSSTSDTNVDGSMMSGHDRLGRPPAAPALRRYDRKQDIKATLANCQIKNRKADYPHNPHKEKPL